MKQWYLYKINAVDHTTKLSCNEIGSTKICISIDNTKKIDDDMPKGAEDKIDIILREK